jgi:hypothetical protein
MCIRKVLICLVGILCLSGCDTMDDDAWVAGPCEPPPPPRERVVFIADILTDCTGITTWTAGCLACTALADLAGLTGTFCPWLATQDGTPAERFTKDGKFVNTMGNLVANSWADLTDGTLQNPIEYTQDGSRVTYFVRTGLDIAGQARHTCNMWSECNNPWIIVDVGWSTAVDAEWTSWPFGDGSVCQIINQDMPELPYYCFQQ